MAGFGQLLPVGFAGGAGGEGGFLRGPARPLLSGPLTVPGCHDAHAAGMALCHMEPPGTCDLPNTEQHAQRLQYIHIPTTPYNNGQTVLILSNSYLHAFRAVNYKAYTSDNYGINIL